MDSHPTAPTTARSILFAPVSWIVLVGALSFGVTPCLAAATSEQLIPILGTTTGSQAAGIVAYIVATFETRTDTSGLMIQFKSSPGHFSHMAQTSIDQAIRRAARSLNLSTDSWTVILFVPYSGMTVYGESLSAMVGLSVAAMAEGRSVSPGHVMTGTITPDGRIGVVGSVPLKITGASEAHLRRVLVPDEQDIADGDWHTPFLMQISPVGSVSQAFDGLTSVPPTP
jgi:hypothetical protein